MNEELVFNIWFIVDIATELSTHFIIRCYNINGTTDKEKTDLLQKLAETDFKTAERIEFVGNARIPHSSLSYIFENDFEYFVQVAEKQLPPKQVCKGGKIEEREAIKQVFSDYPLYVWTVLIENEFGELRPLTSPENKGWFAQEKARILLA